MLADSFQLDYNDLAAAAQSVTFERVREDGSKLTSTYNGTNHTDILPEKFQGYVTEPKPTGTFLGQKKARAKFTLGATVQGSDLSDMVRNAILTIDTSVPVGLNDESRHKLFQLAVKWLQNSLAVKLHIDGIY